MIAIDTHIMRAFFYNQSNSLRIVWRMLLFILIAFGINIPVQIVLGNVLEQGLLRGLLSSSAFLFSVFIAYRVEVKKFAHSTFAAYGFKIDRSWWTQFAVGCAIPALQLGVFFAFTHAMGYIDIIGYFNTTNDYSFAGGFLSEVWSHLVTGVTEEVIHRSVLFLLAFEGARRLGKSIKTAAILGCVFSSLVFGLGHSGNEAASIFSTLNLWMDAFILCLPFLITGKLAMSIAMHFSWNLIQGAILGFPVSGYPAKVSMMELQIEHNLWTGGAFGPEASALFIVLNLLALGVILWYKKVGGYEYWINMRFFEKENNRSSRTTIMQAA